MNDIDILRRAHDFENDPRRPKKLVGQAWQHHAVGATKNDIKRLKDQGYVEITVNAGALIKYQLTEKGKQIVWAQAMEDQFIAPAKSEVLEALDLVVGFDDIKEILSDALATRRRINILFEGPPASIQGDTEVWVDIGNGPQSIAISSLVGKEIKSLSVHPTTLRADWYPAEVSEHIYGGEWVEITGVGVLPFSVTATHSLVSYDPILGCLIPKKAGEIVVGDILPIISSYPLYEPPLGKILINDELLELGIELGFLLGFWLGDGGLNQGENIRITFTNENRSILQRIKKYLSGLKSPGNYWCGGAINNKALVVQHQPLFNFLKTEFLYGDGKAGLKGRTARWKSLPGWVMNSPQQFVCALLNGYFYADGTVSNGVISATTTSPRLARDISMLITRLGIVPGIQRRGNSAQAIVIRQCDAKKFMDKVGVFRENKTVSTAVILHDESFKVPFPFTIQLASSIAASIRKGGRSQSMTRRAAIEYLANDWASKLSTLLDADIRWVRVEKLRRFQEPSQTVYDLSVPGAENFVLGNRVVVHNCAKSVMLDGIRHAVPTAYQAFGSRTSAAGLSDVLFEMRPAVLLLDEADKMRHDVYAVLLGLMEKGEILETKVGKTRGVGLETTVIAACNSSKKMTQEFLSRFAFHAHFPEYSRSEYIDVVVGMLTRAEGCPVEIAELIGGQVYDNQLGDVRKARGVWNIMKEPTQEEVDRVILVSLKYGPQGQGNNRKKKPVGLRLPGL